MKVASYLIADFRPFTTVESPEFRDIILECEPRYKFPNRATFSEKIIPSLHEVVAARVKADMSIARSVALMCDSWTSRATDSYITITAHYVNRDFEPCSVVLQTRELKESHTGLNTATVLTASVAEWGCTVGSLATYNAANMKIAAKAANMSHVGCFAHTINLAANKATDVRTVSNLLAKIRPIIGYFHRSTVAAAILTEKQNLLKLPIHKLINEVKTRWNSSYLMVQRFLEQQVAIMAALMDDRLKKQRDADTLSSFTSDEVRNAEDFVTVMEPLYHATLAMSEEKKTTGSLVLPLLEKLKNNFQRKDGDRKFVADIKMAVLANLQSRYTQQEFLEEVTALDPRVKQHTTEDTWQRVITSAAKEQVTPNYI